MKRPNNISNLLAWFRTTELMRGLVWRLVDMWEVCNVNKLRYGRHLPATEWRIRSSDVMYNLVRSYAFPRPCGVTWWITQIHRHYQDGYFVAITAFWSLKISLTLRRMTNHVCTWKYNGWIPIWASSSNYKRCDINATCPEHPRLVLVGKIIAVLYSLDRVMCLSCIEFSVLWNPLLERNLYIYTLDLCDTWCNMLLYPSWPSLFDVCDPGVA